MEVMTTCGPDINVSLPSELNELDAETVRERADAVLTRAPDVLGRHGFEAGPLATMQARLDTNRLPADDIIELFREHESLAEVLRTRTGLAGTDAQNVDPSDNGAARTGSRQSVTEKR